MLRLPCCYRLCLQVKSPKPFLCKMLWAGICHSIEKSNQDRTGLQNETKPPQLWILLVSHTNKVAFLSLWGDATTKATYTRKRLFGAYRFSGWIRYLYCCEHGIRQTDMKLELISISSRMRQGGGGWEREKERERNREREIANWQSGNGMAPETLPPVTYLLQ